MPNRCGVPLCSASSNDGAFPLALIHASFYFTDYLGLHGTFYSCNICSEMGKLYCTFCFHSSKMIATSHLI